MFRDESEIHVKAGRGGDGCVSFRREKFSPKGGPDGGDGGHGGSVVIKAVPHLNTLLLVSRKKHYKAAKGLPGQSKDMTGASADDLVIEVPAGTLVHDSQTGLLIKDLALGDSVVVAAGGKPGKGNHKFATSINQTPRQFTFGEEGEDRIIRLELKLIADVGIVGLPNAGKSTLLSRLSNATPKIADYPFTTLEPTLGIVGLGDYRSFVMADLPGLIEGAHKGSGLGDRFLKHIERTRLIVHLVEASPVEGLPSPEQAYAIVRKELESYSPTLASKPEILALTKMDIPESSAAAEAFAAATGKSPVVMSAVTGAGLPRLLEEISRVLFPVT